MTDEFELQGIANSAEVLSQEISLVADQFQMSYLGKAFDTRLEEIMHMNKVENRLVAFHELAIDMRAILDRMLAHIKLLSMQVERQGKAMHRMAFDTQTQFNMVYENCELVRQDMEHMYLHTGLPTYGIIGSARKTKSSEEKK